MKITGAKILHGLAHQEYEIVYQPQYDIRTMNIVGAEALLRWKQPGMNASPLQIIAACLQHGLMAKFGEVIVRRVCRQLATWQKTGPVVPIAINMNPIELSNDYPDMIQNALSDAGILPSLIEIELTEGSDFPDFDIALESMKRLSEMGITLTADDFGIGFSSLQNIARLPIGKIKIDQSFVRNAPYLRADKAVITAVIKLAHSLGRSVLGEGTETADEVALLRALGCNLFQGFYFSKPLPAADFYHLLIQNLTDTNDNNGNAHEKLAHC